MALDSNDFLIPAQPEFVRGSASGGNRPRLYLIAYSGGLLKLPNYDAPVVIDLTSATFAKDKTPIIADHNYGVEGLRLGFSTSQSNTGEELIIEAVITNKSPEAMQLIDDMKAGFPMEASVGASPGSTYKVEAGQRVFLNNRTFEGPVIVAEDTVIRETSVVLLGADSQTAARIAASIKRGVTSMSLDEFVQSLGFDPQKISAEQDVKFKAMFAEKEKLKKEKLDLEASLKKADDDLKAAQAKIPTTAPKKKEPVTDPEILAAEAAKKATEAIVAAEKSAMSIKATFAKYAEVDKLEVSGKEITAEQYCLDAITAGSDPNEVELNLLRASRTPANFNIGTLPPSGDMSIRSDAIVASILAQHGVPMSHDMKDGKKVGLEHTFSEKVLEASQSKELRSISLHQLMDQSIRATGRSFTGNRRGNDFIEAFFQAEQELKIKADGAVSTLGVTSILEDAANKNLLSAYQMQNVVWPAITQTRTLNDFKTHKYYRLTIEGGYSMVAPDGQIGHGRQSDQRYTLDANTYGMIVALTRTDIVNDDLDAFMQISAGLGRLAATALEIAVIRTVLDSDWAGAWTDRVAATNPLGLPGLTASDTKFMQSMDDDSKPIMVSPDRILVPSALKFTSTELFRSDILLATGTGSSAAREAAQNLHAGSFTPFASQILDNTNLTDMDGAAISAAQSAVDWYMLADPATIAAYQVGFLNGQQTPVIESGQLSFDRLGIQWRSYHDWAVGYGDKRGVIKNDAA